MTQRRASVRRLAPCSGHNYRAATMTDTDENQNASGSWQPDPTGRYKLRWRDAAGGWTDHVYSSEGEMGNDPFDAPPPPPPERQLESHRAPVAQPPAETVTRAEARKARSEAKKAELRQRLADQKSLKADQKAFKKAQQEAVKSASGMGAKLLALARLHLDEDETDLCSVRGTYETKRLGSDSVRSGILIATNKRIVFYAKKATGHDINFFRYKAISSIDTGKNMMGAYITLVVSGNEANLKWIKDGDAAGFVETVQDQMENA